MEAGKKTVSSKDFTPRCSQASRETRYNLSRVSWVCLGTFSLNIPEVHLQGGVLKTSEPDAQTTSTGSSWCGGAAASNLDPWWGTSKGFSNLRYSNIRKDHEKTKKHYRVKGGSRKQYRKWKYSHPPFCFKPLRPCDGLVAYPAWLFCFLPEKSLVTEGLDTASYLQRSHKQLCKQTVEGGSHRGCYEPLAVLSPGVAGC